MRRASRAATTIAAAANSPGTTASSIAGRIPSQATSPAASSGPATAPRLSPARSTPNARPYADRGASEASRLSRAGDRSPRDSHATARSAPACHTVAASPIAPVATAVPR